MQTEPPSPSPVPVQPTATPNLVPGRSANAARRIRFEDMPIKVAAVAFPLPFLQAPPQGQERSSPVPVNIPFLNIHDIDDKDEALEKTTKKMNWKKFRRGRDVQPIGVRLPIMPPNSQNLRIPIVLCPKDRTNRVIKDDAVVMPHEEEHKENILTWRWTDLTYFRLVSSYPAALN